MKLWNGQAGGTRRGSRGQVRLPRLLGLGSLIALLGLQSAIAQPPDQPPLEAAAQPVAAGRFQAAVNHRSTPLRVTSLRRYATAPLTVELWTKLGDDKKARYNLLVSHLPQDAPGHWEIYTTPLDGLLTVRVRGEQLLTLPTFVRITDGQWHYVAMTYGDDQVTVYVDAKQVARGRLAPARDAWNGGDGELFVGTELQREWAAQQPGFIDELRISGVVRPIQAVPSAPFDADDQTVGLWHFDETDGNAYHDASPLGNVLAYSPGVDSAWTPRSAVREDAPDWEKETDDDWHDARFDAMDKGPVLGCAMSIPAARGNDQRAFAAKGLAIQVGEDADTGVLFDRALLQLSGGWTGGFVHIPSRRFGLIQRPEPVGEVSLAVPRRPGCLPPQGDRSQRTSEWGPLPKPWGEYHGYFRHDDAVILSYRMGESEVLEKPGTVRLGPYPVITRDLEMGPSAGELTLDLLTLPGAGQISAGRNHSGCFVLRDGRRIGVLVTSPAAAPTFKLQAVAATTEGRTAATDVHLVLAAHHDPLRLRIHYVNLPETDFSADMVDALPTEVPSLRPLTAGGPSRWTETITTRGQCEQAAAEPLAVDTLTLPVDNPYKSVFRVTGIGFLPDGRIAICTIYGDVWLVDGVSDDLHELKWKRYASGLYQPMGLVVRDGEILVLERGQVTRLHDFNGDDEADFYENYYDGWQETGDGHAYDTGLQLAADGALFLFKGQTSKPEECRESGCLLRIAPDRQSHEIVATGFRHPIGLGLSPGGLVTGADQQGNWMPATRIDAYRQGGFYGDMRTHHRDQPPPTYDPPICWLPRDVDNSAGGQVWVPPGHWGPLGGTALHLSWGRCRLYQLMFEPAGEYLQGGVVPLPCATLLSGPITGGFRPADGHLYVVGLHGWQTAAEQDGCLQRIRYRGQPLHLPTGLHVEHDGLRIDFAEPLDRAAAEDIGNFAIHRWNYRWSESYGSDHWSVAQPNRQGHDAVTIRAAQLSADRRSVVLKIDDLRPVMQMRVDYRLKSAAGDAVQNTIHHTIHTVPEAD